MPTSFIDWPAVRGAAAFRLALPRTPVGGRLGERLGAGTGSSLEFQDYRGYAPGDDLRHVDWAAYARSELLAVRLYREEVAPRIDVILDVSRSMALTDRKHRGFGELAGLISCACTNTVADARIITAPAADPRRLQRPEDIEAVLQCDATLSALEGGHLPLRRRSLRVVISDFLFPHDADALVSRLARDGASLSIVQLTLHEEAEPELDIGRRLIDVEPASGASISAAIASAPNPALATATRRPIPCFKAALRVRSGRAAGQTDGRSTSGARPPPRHRTAPECSPA